MESGFTNYLSDSNESENAPGVQMINDKVTTYIDRIKKGLGEAIRLRRIELDISQNELAQKVGCGRNYINQIENGHLLSITLERLIRLALALDYTFTELCRKAEHL